MEEQVVQSQFLLHIGTHIQNVRRRYIPYVKIIHSRSPRNCIRIHGSTHWFNLCFNFIDWIWALGAILLLVPSNEMLPPCGGYISLAKPKSKWERWKRKKPTSFEKTGQKTFQWLIQLGIGKLTRT